MRTVDKAISTMWYDELPAGSSWAALWSGYILCGHCSGIQPASGACPGCGGDAVSWDHPVTVRVGGKEVQVPCVANGAEGRYEDWVYLQMLQREWERPAPAFERFASFPDHERPSARAALVILFWTYFETRLERLLTQAMHALPSNVREDLLDRYSSIGARLYRLCKVLFGRTYFEDLIDCGYPAVAAILTDLHTRRNEFAHGMPQAIDDGTVRTLVESLKVEHEAWIAVFNKRAAKLKSP